MRARSIAATEDPFRAAVWRDFLRLAAEGLTIGIFVSAVLGLAVLAIASQSPAREQATTPPAEHSTSDRGGPANGGGSATPIGSFHSA